MATQKEIADQLAAIAAQLKDIGAAVDATTVEVVKVGAETEALQRQIADLQALIASGAATQELADAASLLAVQAWVVKTATDSVAAAVKAVDDKVPDVAAPASSGGGLGA